MPPNNYYEILGIDPSATPQQVKEAYRREAMKWHPDRVQGDREKEEAHRRFKRIAEAYRTLKDPELRAAHDRELNRARQQSTAGPDTGSSSRQEQAGRTTGGTDSKRRPDQDSDEAANAMFFEQMLDLGRELAERGFPQERIAAALVTLGCPASMAEAVAKFSRKSERGGTNATRSAKLEPRDSVDVRQLPWDEAEIYYRAFIQGDRKVLPIREENYQALLKRRKNRFWQVALVILTSIALAVLTKPNGKPITEQWLMGTAIAWVLAGLWYIIGSLADHFNPDWHGYISERKTRHYIEKFKILNGSERGFRYGFKTFNVIAYAFGILWLPHRKMYRELLLFCVGFIIWTTATVVVAKMSEASGLEKIGEFSVTLLAQAPQLVLALFGTSMLLRKATKTINNHLNQNDHANALNAIRKSGGTSNASTGVMLILVIGSLSAVIAIPAYNDYQRRIAEQRAAMVRAEQQRIADQAAAAERARQQAAAAEKARRETEDARIYAQAVTEYERRYPFLNPDSPRFNRTATAWIMERMGEYQRMGESKIDALRHAISDMEFEMATPRRN